MLDPISVGVLGLIVLFILLMLRMPVGITMIVVASAELGCLAKL